MYRMDRDVAKQGLAGYRQFFELYDQDQHMVLLEATPDYMYQKTPFEVIPMFPRLPLVIFILRQPSARIYSLFRFAQHSIGRLNIDMSFLEFITKAKNGGFPENWKILRNAIEHSRYSDYLQRWYDAVGRSNVHICLFEKMIKHPDEILKQIALKLSINLAFYDNYSFEQKNKTHFVRSQLLHKLYKIYPIWLKGPFRTIGSSVYGWINLKSKKHIVSEEDKTLLKELEQEFTASKRELQLMTGLDLSCWD